ncbi:hypothetical protein [Geoglobus ahangari]
MRPKTFLNYVVVPISEESERKIKSSRNTIRKVIGVILIIASFGLFYVSGYYHGAAYTVEQFMESLKELFGDLAKTFFQALNIPYSNYAELAVERAFEKELQEQEYIDKINELYSTGNTFGVIGAISGIIGIYLVGRR